MKFKFKNNDYEIGELTRGMWKKINTVDRREMDEMEIAQLCLETLCGVSKNTFDDMSISQFTELAEYMDAYFEKEMNPSKFREDRIKNILK